MESRAFMPSRTSSTTCLSQPSKQADIRSGLKAAKPVLPQAKRAKAIARRRHASTWRMQVADPLDSFRDSFGNECEIEIRARQELEETETYRTVSQQVADAKAELAALLATERYQSACEARDRLSKLQLQKRILELEAKPRVSFRIGDLVLHKKYGYRGVVYGHDPQCSAPQNWQDAMKVDLLRDGPGQPFYHVLVDTRDRPGGMSTYVAQENLIVQREPRPVDHPWVQKFFVGFEEDIYVPGQRLRQVYPNDW